MSLYSQAPAVRGSVGGIVLNADSTAPWANAQVSLDEIAGNKRIDSATDDQGRYEVTDLPLGRYLVSARATDRSYPVGKTVTLGGSAPDHVSLNFEIEEPGVISGKVMDDRGEPVPYATVSLIAKEYQAGSLRSNIASAPRPTTEASTG